MAQSTLQIAVQFSETMHQETITSDTIVLTEAGDDEMHGTSDDQVFNLDVIYQRETNSAIVIIPDGLNSGYYRVTIDASVTAESGYPLAETVRSHFEVDALDLVSFIPESGLYPSLTSLVATFSRELNPASITTDALFLRESGPDQTFDTVDDFVLNPDEFIISPDQTTVTMAFPDGLPGGDFRFSITTELMDRFGHRFPGGEVREFSVEAPNVNDFFPLNESENELLTLVTASFDKPISQASINPNTVVLIEAGPDGSLGTADDVTVESGVLTGSEASLQRTFETGLPSGFYQVTLTSGITDVLGHPIQPFTWTFNNEGGTEVVGQVLFADQSPAVGAAVRLRGLINKRDENTTTDAAGRFSFPNISTTAYDVIQIEGIVTIGDQVLSGHTQTSDLVRDGVTDVGIITLTFHCDPVFQEGVFPQVSSINGPVHTLIEYNGRLFLGGQFFSAGGIDLNYIATWDGSSFAPVDIGLSDQPYAMTVFNDGTGDALYVTGSFFEAGGVLVNRIAKWDGKSWSSLGSGLNHTGRALAVFNDGSGDALFVGGEFTEAGGQPAMFLAMWDGQSWHSVGGGLSDSVRAMAVFNQALHVGGHFIDAGDITTQYIARWDGKAWSALANGLAGPVFALHAFDPGDGERLYVGGEFLPPSPLLPGMNSIGSWDGSNWSALGEGLTRDDDGGGHVTPEDRTGGIINPGQVAALLGFNDGSGPALFVTGDFDLSGNEFFRNIAKWQEGRFLAVDGGLRGSPNPDVEPTRGNALSTLSTDSGAPLYVGGNFNNVGFKTSWYLAKAVCPDDAAVDTEETP